MENLNYDLVSDCCGAACGFETGEGSDRIGICTDCQEWCGVVEINCIIENDSFAACVSFESLRQVSEFAW